MKWIKVEDSLPKKTGEYLCVLIMASGIEGVEDEQIYELCTFYYKHDNYFHHKYFDRDVSHWMNLPNLPSLND